MKTIKKRGIGEIIEKKSRFIGTIEPVSSVEEAASFFDEIRKTYWDARHNCTAFITAEEGQPVMRSSDDGEPSGTAGKPMLEVLVGEELSGVALVVTRYFGGILLGTGGLVRAYQAAAKAAIAGTDVVSYIPAKKFALRCDYTLFGKLQNIAALELLLLENITYTDAVSADLTVPIEDVERIRKKLLDETAGKVVLEEGEDVLMEK